MIRETIENFLQKYNIPRDAGFIVTVSGGADSISLLHAFKYLNLKILVLHCNFNLRGKESDMDEQFVKRFCDSYGIAHSVKKFDTIGYAHTHGLSIEMAARELRYAWFKEMKTKKKMDYIVVAHHADDVAETIFINLCRGTGIKGLTGIKAVNEDILRPLLECSRADILKYIEENQLGYRTDSTNNSQDYLRNKIRHLVIPVFKEMNPSFLETISDNCEVLKETEEIFMYGIRQLQEQIWDCEGDEILIDIAKTLATPAPYTLLYETLRPFGFNKVQIRDILNTHSAHSGKQFIAGSYILVKGRTYWRLYDDSQHSQISLLIEKEGVYSIGHKKFELTIQARTPEFEIPADPTIACLDADKMKFPLLIRNWQAGDYFCPIGMKRSKKKLSDFFVDQKFSAKQKKDCLLLLSEDQISWVVDHRPDDRFKITSFTKNILVVKEWSE
ncbi:MAG: tRNA lysidine(34) synthetase TilS [Odoribacter sp.]